MLIVESLRLREEYRLFGTCDGHVHQPPLLLIFPEQVFQAALLQEVFEHVRGLGVVLCLDAVLCQFDEHGERLLVEFLVPEVVFERGIEGGALLSFGNVYQDQLWRTTLGWHEWGL